MMIAGLCLLLAGVGTYINGSINRLPITRGFGVGVGILGLALLWIGAGW